MIEVLTASYQELQLQVFDLAGRQILQKQSSQNSITLERNNLSQGMYLYRLIGDGQLLDTGKIMAQ